MALSDLPDDLLRRILHFTPAKEAASTTALAQRWRSLWPSSGAVNLDFFSYSSRNQCSAFFHGAEAALAASRAPIRRLNFHLEGLTHTKHRMRQTVPFYPVLDTVLSRPAARHVEELRVTASHGQVRVPNLSIRSLPFESLRVLDISTCNWLPLKPAELELPRLEAMRLHRCDIRAKDLQAMIDRAQLLTTLQLHEVHLVGPCKRIRCPRVTTLVLADLDWRESSSWRGGMELDVPMLRSFRYRGFLRRFLLEPPATKMLANVDLDFVGDNEHRHAHEDSCRLFWQFVNNFSNVKTLKLKLVHLEHIIMDDKSKTAKFYTQGGDTLFINLHRLDLQAFYTLGRKAGGVAFANFLHCCPVIRFCGLELSTVDGNPFKRASHVQDLLDEEGKLDLCKSVDRFIRLGGDFLDGEHDFLE
ncbi:unnamed protein product [Alopecurus aequalis]